jgi:hypothetical protein
MFPLLGMVSSAVIVMSAQLKGPREALLDCLFAMALLGGMAALLQIAAITWSVWLALGTVAWRTGSLTLVIQAIVILALVGSVVFQLVIGDPLEFWREPLTQIYANFAAEGLDVEMATAQLAPLMSGIVLAGVLTSSMLVVLLGSALAGRVSGRSLVQQFLTLRLGYVIGGLAGLVGVATLLGFELEGPLLVFGAAFMFHGIAVATWWAKARSWLSGWWIGLCILPALLPDFMIVEATLLAALGFVDNWYDLRRAQAPG